VNHDSDQSDLNRLAIERTVRLAARLRRHQANLKAIAPDCGEGTEAIDRAVAAADEVARALNVDRATPLDNRHKP
jgi:hypothetical protein